MKFHKLAVIKKNHSVMKNAYRTALRSAGMRYRFKTDRAGNIIVEVAGSNKRYNYAVFDIIGQCE